MIRFRALQDDLRSSLFFVPMLFVIGGAVAGEALLLIDERVHHVPTGLTATVDSARSVLSVVAGATLAFAGIAFSVSLLLISLASSQYSPRVVHGLFRDPFNKRIMGVVVGTFTYCLVVMRAVRGPLEDAGSPVVPSISILLAVVFGVVSILSIVAFISHSAHTMDVSQILHSVTVEALDQLEANWPHHNPNDDEDEDDESDITAPEGGGFVVTFDRHGWVQQIDYGALFALLEPGACMRLDTVAGRYAIPNTLLGEIWPVPRDTHGALRAARAAVLIGETRTMQQDVSYGVRQLADVALKALSPGINDPTTAQDALFHMGAVVREMLDRPALRRRVSRDDGRLLLLPQTMTKKELIGIAFEEIRLAAATQPTVLIYVLEILHLLTSSLDPGTNASAVEALRREADLVLEISNSTSVPTWDHERVRWAHSSRFGD